MNVNLVPFTAMKKISLFTSVILSLAAFTSNAQEPTKPTYENRVYTADGNYYVQKSLPVYLKFSVSPDGEDYALKSKQHPEDANPMYLDTEGVNYIRSRYAVDPNTGNAVSPQREVLMEMYADGMSPRTTLRFDGAAKYVKGGTTYFGKNLSFSLSSTDAVSGVMETQYALNGAYSKYGSSVSASKEGAQTLYYYSADFVGNTEKTKSNAFTVDLTPPSSSHAIEGIVHNSNIIAPSTSFKLTTSDNLSGVRSVLYSFDDGSNKSYSPNIRVSQLADGEHTLHYYAIDNVKNEATKSSFNFYLDKIPPVVTLKIVGDQHKGNYMYVSPRTKMNLTATDNKSGVHKIYYRIDGGERADYGSDFPIPDKLGVHSFKYDATDNVENLAPNKYQTVFMDNRAPETGITYGKPQFFDRDTLFVTSNTKITLKSRDRESGVQNTMYSVNGAGMKAYSEFTLPSEGYYTIDFNATDNVNNKEQDKQSKCFVDNTPPDIFVNFSIEPIGTRNGLKVYPNYVRMYIGATDKHTGTEAIMYSIDGGPETLYSSPQTLDISEMSKFRKNQKYSVVVTTKDKLGNKAEETFEFFVGRE